MNESEISDLLILGAGPAGLSLGQACAKQGLSVHILSPQPEQLWPQSYGAFAEDVDAVALQSAVQSTHAKPLVWTSTTTPHRLDTPYLRFSTERLQKLLHEGVKQAGARISDERAVSLEHESELSHVHCESGRKYTGRLLIDASGSCSLWSRRTRSAPLGYQTAYGEWLEVSENPLALDEMYLMDFRPVAPSSKQSASGAFDALPTFLYAIPESGTRLFLQETALATEHIVPFSLLKSRLAARREALGLRAARTLSVEKCVLPLGLGFPTTPLPLLPYGAAAGMVHPSTGYQLAHALRKAPLLAQSLAQSKHLPRAQRLEAARAELWPTPDKRAYQIYHAGLQVLLRLDPQETHRFFSSFFSLPRPLWLGFMTGRLPPSQIATAMWRIFTHAPPSLKKELLWQGAWASPQLFTSSSFS